MNSEPMNRRYPSAPGWTRRRSLQFLSGLTGAWLLQGCTSSDTDNTLSVGITPWPGYAGHYVAMAKGFFEAEGIEVKETFFQDGGAGLTAFLAKQVEVSWLTSADVIQGATQEPSIKIIKLADYSNGADGILGRNVSQPEDLEGKRVAREDLLFVNIVLLSYLEQGGLGLADVDLIDTPSGTAAAAFTSNQVDAAVTYEPYLSQAAQDSDGEIIFSTAGTNLIADVIASREAVIENKREVLLAYLRAVDRGVQLINAGDEEALAIVGTQLGVSAEEAKQQIDSLKVFELSEDKQVAFNPENPNSLIQNLEFTAKVATDLGLIDSPVEITSLYDDALIQSL